MKISVFGLGFVGLTTALGFSDKGFTVYGFDINTSRTAEIKSGKIPFLEPGLDETLHKNLGKTFTLPDNESRNNAIKESDVCFISVGTPALPDGHAKLEHIFSVIDSFSDIISPDCLIVIKSTVPPGTTVQKITSYIREKGLRNPVANNPEFLREGHCWKDFTKPDRIVCGVLCESAKSLLSEIYAEFAAPIHFVTPDTAEFIKYLSNSLLATLISFSNEMTLFAEKTGGINVPEAFRILHEDHRLAGAGINSYIYPGCGYGGYCLPKDTTALSALAHSKGYTPQILDSVIELNNRMPALTAQKIIASVKSKNEPIGILGLSFKPNASDVRYSPAAKIIESLNKYGYNNIFAYDPVVNDEFQRVYGLPATYCDCAEDVIKASETIAVVTIWDEFKFLRKNYHNKNWIDCRYFMEG
jgi:UDPglucose 6-dehydrogenase